MQRVVLGERLSRLFFRLLAVLAQVQTQARQQHRRRRGFQDIVVGAHFQRQDMVHVAVERGEQHDRAGEGGRRSRHSVMPSLPGSMMSSSTKSGCSRSMRACARRREARSAPRCRVCPDRRRSVCRLQDRLPQKQFYAYARVLIRKADFSIARPARMRHADLASAQRPPAIDAVGAAGHVAALQQVVHQLTTSLSPGATFISDFANACWR